MSLFHMIQVPFREMPFRLFWATGLYIFPPIPLLARVVVIYIFQRNKSGPLSSYYSSLGLPSSTSNHRTYVNCFMYPYSFFPCDRLPYNPTALPLDGVVLSQKKPALKFLFQGVTGKPSFKVLQDPPVTIAPYQKLWKMFTAWLISSKNSAGLSPFQCESYYFNKGAITSSVNARLSAINFFTFNLMNLEENIFLKGLFKFLYQTRPSKPWYKEFWSVDNLLALLRSWHPKDKLSLKKLTLKTITLVATSS